MPPIRLHDLRHGAATLALAAAVELKGVQEMLGHSSIVLTADTYTSVLPEVAHKAAEKTATRVLKAARLVPGTNAPAAAHQPPRIDADARAAPTGECGLASRTLIRTARSDVRKDAEPHRRRPAGWSGTYDQSLSGSLSLILRCVKDN